MRFISRSYGLLVILLCLAVTCGGTKARWHKGRVDQDVADVTAAATCPLKQETTPLGRCKLVKESEACQIDGGLLDYISFYFCTIEEQLGSSQGSVVGILILSGWLVLLMSLLASTADMFLIPPLTRLSDYLHLSPAVAGVTLLALGNGAPDIVTAHAAIHTGDDLPLVLTALLGAALLTTTTILASVILAAKNGMLKDVSRSSYLRDIFMYLAIVTSTICFCYDGRFTLWEALGFLVVYTTYAVSLIIQHQRHRWRQHRHCQHHHVNIEDLGGHREAHLLAGEEEEEHAAAAAHEDSSDGLSPSYGNGHAERSLQEEEIGNGSSSIKHLGTGGYVALPSPTAGEISDTDLSEQSFGYSGRKRRRRRKEERDIEGLSLPRENGKIVMPHAVRVVLESPFTLLRYLTAPIIDKSWGPERRTFCILWPVPLGLLFTISASNWKGLSAPLGASPNTLPVYALVLIVGLACSLLLTYLTRDLGKTGPQGIFRGLLSAIAMLSAILWMSVFAGEVVAVVETFGKIFGVSSGILGVTVLAISNSLGDWFSNVAVSRAGRTNMGISAVFGAIVLNDLLGLGISLAVYCIRHKEAYIIDIQSITFQQVKLLWLLLIPHLLLSLGVFWYTNFSPGKNYAIFLVIYYLLFLLLSILLETGNLGQGIPF